jgi:hypothetical protein
MKWAAVILLLAIAGYLLFRWGSKPIHYRHMTTADFPRFTKSLISQGGDGALLFICHEGSERFVQFAKYLFPARELHFGFPDAPWSRNYFRLVEAALTDAGFSCIHRATGDDGAVRSFLCIDRISSPEDGARIATIAFGAMGLGTEALYAIHKEGPVSGKEWKSYEAAKREKS